MGAHENAIVRPVFLCHDLTRHFFIASGHESILKAARGDRMPLFRRQALDHHNRLHGDIFLVPPLRWQAIGWLLLGLVCAGGACLAFGSFSLTIKAEGSLHMSNAIAPARSNASSRWTARVTVPLAQIDDVHQGQQARVSLAGADAMALSGTITAVATHMEPGNISVPVEIQLTTQGAEPRNGRVTAIDGQPVTATILVERVRLWRWLFGPVLSRNEQ
ncbi:hypothetical protein M2337_001740 [Sphingobium sp. B2D3A]|uniref:HlyD family secretion protein n=1 Tax=unclassified Sphingobium TaxID=2611147 RepID=UPI0022259F36|nr:MULTISPECIES: HlyD family secretion protein [unclassified Sphingobium]MCW2337507.1 hypothetical protein [Sphingobium sp. B2D3A]MCW2383965.1 hypothetical protein [Sphingobium sp. B2D3D]